MYGLYAVIHGKPTALIAKGREDTLVTRALSITSVTNIGSEVKTIQKLMMIGDGVRALLVRRLDTDELVFSVIL